MNDYMIKFNETVDYIKEKVKELPKIAIILGSGLGSLADDITDQIVLPYKDIPNFPISTVAGHKGELIFGKLEGVQVVAMSGKFHYYEGNDLKTATFPIRVFSLLGVKTVIMSNAAGAINTSYKKGDLMIINDHLSFFCESALRGPNMDEFGPRFIDMSTTYDKEYIAILKDILKDITSDYHEGVYAYMKGPAYETPAEIRALRTLGGDVVGMSTVPEAVVAHHCGMRCAAITCVTNMAAGVTDDILSHEDVLETAHKAEQNFNRTIHEFVRRI